MSKPRRITELQLTTNPSISDLIALARVGSNSKVTIGTILNSEFPATFGDVTVNGNLRVSSLVSASILYESGSTLFGNSMDDTHTFTGSIYMSGSLGSPEWIDFKLDNAVTAQPGRVWWDPEEATMNVGVNNDVDVQI